MEALFKRGRYNPGRDKTTANKYNPGRDKREIQ